MKDGKRIPMNLPNTITLIRIALIPVCLALLTGQGGWRIAAAAVFAAAAFTDHIDGSLARKRNEVTDFGKFIDPIADKLLVLLPLICLLGEAPRHAGFAVAVLTARELIVSGFRMVAGARGKVIAAAWSGKVKTVVQIIAVLAVILAPAGTGWAVAAWIAVWVSAAVSLYSGAEILWKNLDVLKETVG